MQAQKAELKMNMIVRMMTKEERRAGKIIMHKVKDNCFRT